MGGLFRACVFFRFQRLIPLFEISWASQRLSAQLNPGYYLLRLRRRPFGPKI